MNIFVEEHQDIIKLLLKCEVDFLLIGGYAVIYHGYRRNTGDLDLWLKPSNSNKEKFVKALKEADFNDRTLNGVSELNFEGTLMFTLGEEPQKIDFLTRISGLEYEDAEKNKVVGDIDGMRVPVVHMNDLVIAKLSTGRQKDKLDIEELQKIAKNKK